MTSIAHFAGATGLLVLAAAALHGWGTALAAITRLPRVAAPVTVALGLAAVLALGGVLNLLRIAVAPALALVAVAGLVLWARAVRASGGSLPPRPLAPALAVAALAIAFAIVTQLPPALFNHHDDLEKYFAHPVRMLATGSLYGSPLSALASETLGGMAFLHAFVVAAFPIQYINGVDAVFGFGLLTTIALTAGARWASAWLGALLAVVATACVEPLYVNVSALYLGAALMLACAVLSADASDGMPSPVALGLMYAALAALKPTFVLFGACHGLLTTAAVGTTRSPAEAARWAVRTAAWTALALAPWLALHAPHYLGAPAAHPTTPPAGAAAVEQAGALLLAATRQHWFTAALGVLAAACAALALRAAGAARWPAAGVLASAGASTVAPLLLVTAFGAWLSDPVTNARYAAPFALALPGVFALAMAVPGNTAVRQSLAAIALVIVAMDSLAATSVRYGHAVKYGAILSYLQPAVAERPAYRAYFRHALSEAATAEVGALQRHVPAGEPVLVWITLPFRLDYARNRIVDVEPGGLGTWWSAVPEDVRYVIWQHAGPAVRRAADYGFDSSGRRERAQAVRATALVEWLRSQKAAGEVLYEDAGSVVFRLQAARVN